MIEMSRVLSFPQDHQQLEMLVADGFKVTDSKDFNQLGHHLITLHGGQYAMIDSNRRRVYINSDQAQKLELNPFTMQSYLNKQARNFRGNQGGNGGGAGSVGI